MMGSCIEDLFSEIDKLRAQLLHNVEVMADCRPAEEEISQ